MKPNASKTQASNDPRLSDAVDDFGRLPMKVCVLDPTEDIHRSGIRRGMHILELGCGAGDLSLCIGKLVGPSGLMVGVDESAQAIDVAQRRATVSGQCYWTRFVNADLKTFIPDERYDAVIVRRELLLQGERASFSRLSTWLRPEGVIIVTGEPAGSTDDGSSIGGK